MNNWFGHPTSLLISFLFLFTPAGQAQSYRAMLDSISAKLQKALGHSYWVSGVDIDQCLNKPTRSCGKIKDPYQTLSGYILYLAEGKTDPALDKPAGVVGLYSPKRDAIIWRSDSLTSEFSSGPMSSIVESGELNGDGKVEFVIAEAGGATAATTILWVFNWDGETGRLITQRDEFGNSNIVVSGDSFEIVDLDGDGISEIQGKDPDALNKTLTYSWNGSQYGSWGKTSKYLVRAKHK